MALNRATDKAPRLLRLLARWYGGEAQALAVARVPTVAEEDQRRLHREREYLVGELMRESNRLRGLLATQGIRAHGEVARWGGALDRMRTANLPGRSTRPFQSVAAVN